MSGVTRPKGELPKVIRLKGPGLLTHPCFTAERAQEERWGGDAMLHPAGLIRAKALTR